MVGKIAILLVLLYVCLRVPSDCRNITMEHWIKFGLYNGGIERLPLYPKSIFHKHNLPLYPEIMLHEHKIKVRSA